MKVKHLSQWETGWIEKALPQFRGPFLSDSTDRSNSSYPGSPKPQTGLSLWSETGRVPLPWDSVGSAHQ